MLFRLAVYKVESGRNNCLNLSLKIIIISQWSKSKPAHNILYLLVDKNKYWSLIVIYPICKYIQFCHKFIVKASWKDLFEDHIILVN